MNCQKIVRELLIKTLYELAKSKKTADPFLEPPLFYACCQRISNLNLERQS